MKEAGIPPKKRGRPVGSKTKKDKAWEAFWKTGTVMDMDDFMKTRDYLPHDEQEGIDVPDMTQWQKGFDEGTGSTNSLTKSKMLSDMREAVESNLLELNDQDLINELKSYTRNDESASSDMKLVNKITLVLTLVNVAILISLVIKNVWMK